MVRCADTTVLMAVSTGIPEIKIAMVDSTAVGIVHIIIPVKDKVAYPTKVNQKKVVLGI